MSSKPKVYITRKVPVEGVRLLAEHCEVTHWDREDAVPRVELLKNVSGMDALFCLLTEKVDAEVLNAAGPQLKCVATMSVGYDHIDLAECKKRGISVGFTPDVLTNAVAELTMALLLATSRRLKEGMNAVIQGKWGTWNPIWLLGSGLDGATVGVVGLGRIGFEVVKRLHPFGVAKVLYSDVEPKSYAKDVNAEYATLDDLLKTSDFVLGCCALTKENMGLFNKDAFSKMKNTAIFVNTSRGGLVNQDDLYAALSTNQIAGAGLDVTNPEPLPTDSPLLKLENCIVLPHIASATIKSRSAMSELTGQNILACLNGKKMPAQVVV
ncbi:hypothetical protein FSP39_012689 [Pinctada imbricata]|uniref:Glyoxylate reductase/hydroxypyruvate reductase n=1 Tax=Pinctada imbricata TaxID=66713 RepID=A0AA88XEB5_PINIB|nr:hypothetical protein FSP39_012689 [Pinctada imbricata]